MGLDWQNRDSFRVQSKRDTSRKYRDRNNLPNPSNCKVTARFSNLARFVIYYPIADAGFNAMKILTGKLVLLSGAVIVDRVQSMDEYPKSHDLSGAASPGNNTQRCWTNSSHHPTPTRLFSSTITQRSVEANLSDSDPPRVSRAIPPTLPAAAHTRRAGGIRTP